MTASAHTGHTLLQTRAQALAFADLTHEHTVITATPLQAKLLNQAYLRKASGHSQHLPDILSFDQWIRQLHYRHPQPKRLLSRFHARQIMHHLVTENLADSTTTYALHTANQILRRLADDHTDTDGFDNADFQHCRALFLAYLKEHNCVTHELLIQHAAEYTSLIQPSEKIVFSGFFSPTPSLHAVWQAIPSPQLFRLVHSQTPAVSAECYEGPQQLFQALAHWSQQAHTDTTTLSLLVVNHKTDTENLYNKLNALLQPKTALMHLQDTPPVATLTRKTIAETPLFHGLLSLLRLCHTPTFLHLQQFWQSPFSQHPDTPPQVYQSLLNLCDHAKDPSITSQSWARFTDNCDIHMAHTPAVAAILQQTQILLDFSTQLSGQETVTAWNHKLHQCLHQFPWPLPSLTTEEQAILDKICHELIHLPSLLAPDKCMDFSAWLSQFMEYFQQTTFPCFSEQSPIIIAHWQDCMDIPCQHLILYAMDAEDWPGEAELPTEHNTLAAWRALQTRMQSQTHTWTHTYSRLDQQNQTLLPSPLVEPSLWQYPQPASFDHPLCPERPQLTAQVPTQHGPPIRAHEAMVSSTTLRSYNHCSSQGFISSRLGVSPPESAALGVPPWVIGQLIHSVLEKTIANPTVVSLCPETLTAVITTCIAEHPACTLLLPPMLAALQTHILGRITLWLEHHNIAHADDAATAVRHEVTTKLQLGPVTVNLRADRIDTFAHDQSRIIDYKTGKVTKSGWLGTRITEPQLPLYALSFPDVHAISYACLHPDQLGYAGLSATDNHPFGIAPPAARTLPPGVETWEDLLDHWRTSLTDTAQAYASGLLRKDPVNGPTTCSMCHFHSICRIYDHQNLEEPA